MKDVNVCLSVSHYPDHEIIYIREFIFPKSFLFATVISRQSASLYLGPRAFSFLFFLLSLPEGRNEQLGGGLAVNQGWPTRAASYTGPIHVLLKINKMLFDDPTLGVATSNTRQNICKLYTTTKIYPTNPQLWKFTARFFLYTAINSLVESCLDVKFSMTKTLRQRNRSAVSTVLERCLYLLGHRHSGEQLKHFSLSYLKTFLPPLSIVRNERFTPLGRTLII